MFKSTDQKLIEKFYNLQTRIDVADLLEIPEKSLRYFLYEKKPENLYVTFKIQKYNKTSRIINAPKKELKSIQRKLAYILNLIYKPKPSAFGFVIDRNIILNANKHIKRKWILNIDLKDFFSQIHFGRVLGMFINKPYNIGKEAAIVMTQIACFNKVLPQGAPTSPILTNMVCAPLDTHLIKYAKNHNLTYTRYADDITFSTYNKELSTKVVNGDFEKLHIGKSLLDVFEKNDFTINEDKIFLNGTTKRQEVTGLVVNKFTNVRREYIKSIRAILHHCKVESVYETAQKYIEKGFCKNKDVESKKDNVQHMDFIIGWFREVLKGKISFVAQVRGKDDLLFLKYAKEMNEIFNENIFDISKLNDFGTAVVEKTVIIRDTNKDEQGSGFLLRDYGLVTSFHVTKNDLFYNVLDSRGAKISFFTKSENEIFADDIIDFAIYDCIEQNVEGLALGDSRKLQICDKVTLVGYPNYLDGNSPNVQTAHVSSITTFLDAPLYTVDKAIFHGASGGVVVNESNEVVGIIKGGVESCDESQTKVNQGFIPIHIVIDYINAHRAK